MPDIHQTFDAIIGVVKERIGERAFMLWFSTMQAASLKDGVLGISVPSEYFLSSVKKYESVLQDAARGAGLTGVSLFVDERAEGRPEEKSARGGAQERQDKNAADRAAHQQAGPESLKSLESVGASGSAEFKQKKTGEYTFENFVVGPSNEFAASTARAVADNPGQAYNPFLIYGPVGLGKTHLLRAVGNKMLADNPKAKVLYMTSEAFLNSYVEAIGAKTMPAFRNRMRRLDALLIDDVQFFAGKSGTQEELFHIFNVLADEEKQMIFASDRPVNQIKDFEERLASRFQSGQSADLQPPTEEMAIAIATNELKKSKRAAEFPPEFISYIAAHMRNNIRDMLGLIRNMVGYAEITKNPVTFVMLKKWVSEHRHPKTQSASSEKIIKATADHFTVSVADLKGKSRSRSITRARYVAMFLLRKHQNLTYTEIGRALGVTHVVALRAQADIEKELESGGALADSVFAVEASL